jgi:hypothetical protein
MACYIIVTAFCSVQSGDIFSAILELPAMDYLPLPGSALPLSLNSRFAIDCLLQASAAYPPFIRMKCVRDLHFSPNIADEIVMLCAVRNLACQNLPGSSSITRH